MSDPTADTADSSHIAAALIKDSLIRLQSVLLRVKNGLPPLDSPADLARKIVPLPEDNERDWQQVRRDDGDELNSIKKAVARVRSTLASTSAAINPTKQRTIIAVLNEINRMYHFEKGYAVACTPPDLIMQSIEEAISWFNPDANPSGP